MFHQRLVISMALIASLLSSSLSAVAQTPADNWNSVQRLTVDTKLSVKLKTGKTVDGRLRSASDSSLTLTAKNGPIDLKRDDIAVVYETLRKSATKSTLIGLGVGAGAGAALGAAAASSDTGDFDKLDQAVLAGLTVIGAVAGTVTGYFLGRKSKKVLIYESK
jgi:hypothetical protein